MQLVGHVPYSLAPIISLFMKRDVNKALVGEKVNRGVGYRLEIPCASAWPSRAVTSALSIKPHPSIISIGRGTILRVWFPGVRYLESILH